MASGRTGFGLAGTAPTHLRRASPIHSARNGWSPRAGASYRAAAEARPRASHSEGAPLHRSNLLLFFLPAFIWGTTWFAIKLQLGVVAPEVSVAWRFGLASLLLLGWCVARRIPLRFPPRDHLAFALLGLLLFGANYVLVYRSEEHLTSGLVAVIFALMVFWNLLGARLFFGTPPPRPT